VEACHVVWEYVVESAAGWVWVVSYVMGVVFLYRLLTCFVDLQRRRIKAEVIQIFDDRCSKCVQMNDDISEVLIFKLLSLFHAQIYCGYYYYYPCYHLYTGYLQLCT